MATGLIERLRQDYEQDLKSAYQRYAEILRGGNDAPEVVADLKKLADRLGKLPEEVEDDYRTMKRVVALRQQIANGAGLDDAYDRAQKRLERFLVAKEKALQRLREKHHEMENQLSGIGGRRSSGYDAIHELNKLKKQHPELLAHEPEAREEDLLAPPAKR